MDNLLFRLRQGELPDRMRPKIYMIWIGMNNLRLNKTQPTTALVSCSRGVRSSNIRCDLRDELQ